MRRFAQFEIFDRWKFIANPLLRQVAFGFSCTVVMSFVRLFIDAIAPSAGPFAVIYPAILVSTLYGRWQAGLVTYFTALIWIWWAVLPDIWSFHFANLVDIPRLVVNATTLLITLGLAEVFRSATRAAMFQCDSEIEKRDTLMRELDHRTKNNFAMVASLLRLQKGREPSIEAQQALEMAANRVHSFASAHDSLYDDGSRISEVSMESYLGKLVPTLFSGAFLDGHITLNLSVDELRLPRDQAVAIGLVVNEAITNAAKHAFAPDDEGQLDISFYRLRGGWQLIVTDNGQGVKQQPSHSSGLGRSLMSAFAAQAKGTATIESLATGTRVTLESESATGA